MAPNDEPVELPVRAGAAIAGRPADPRGRPMPTVSLQASRAGGNLADVAWTRVDDREGRFLISGLSAGRTHLSLMRDQVQVPLGEVESPAKDLTIVVPDP